MVIAEKVWSNCSKTSTSYEDKITKFKYFSKIERNLSNFQEEALNSGTFYLSVNSGLLSLGSPVKHMNFFTYYKQPIGQVNHLSELFS